MRHILFLSFLFLLSCNKDESATPVTPTPEEKDYAYHAHIHTPNTTAKHVDDTMPIHIEFESHAGEAVHHINVRIYNKETNKEIYNKPEHAHVHGTSGLHEFIDNFVLSETNGVSGHTNWMLEAKVWGEEAGAGEVIEKVEFHVHP